MSLPPKAGTSGGGKNGDIPSYDRGFALGAVDDASVCRPASFKIYSHIPHGVNGAEQRLGGKAKAGS